VQPSAKLRLAAAAAGNASDPSHLSVAESRRRRALVALSVVVATGSLAAPIAFAGIWDPPELRAAELARRIACTVLGDVSLALEGTDNSVPSLGELARGQLPFTSIALGFRIFGLHEWAGRLPLVLWGLLGLAATALLVGRLADRIAAAFALLVLATMPLYFLHARTMLGDIVTMASVAASVAGLALATFDTPAVRRRWRPRAAWLGLGLLGLATGLGARGLLLGVALPALGVGLGWVVVLASRRAAPDRVGDLCGGLALTTGVAALALGMHLLGRTAEHSGELVTLLGAAPSPPAKLPTFDLVIRELGHGLFPWSAVLPFVLGWVFRRPCGVSGSAEQRETSLRVTLVVVSAVGFGIHTAIAPTVGHVPYAPVFALAAILALALRDFDRGAPGSAVTALGVSALAVLFYHDLRIFPEKALSAFGVGETKFPESFEPTAGLMLLVGTAVLITVFFFSVVEQSRPAAGRFHRADYLSWPRALRSVHGGNLLFGLLVLEATLVGLVVLSWLSQRWLHLRQLQQLGSIPRAVVAWGWLVLPAAVALVPAAIVLLRDLARAIYAKVGCTRAVGAALGVATCGLLLSFGYYPALAAQISPKQVFDAYRTLAGAGEPLAMVGPGSGNAAYYAGQQVRAFSSATAGFTWLMSGTERRWMVVRQGDLAQLNSLYRRKTAAAGHGPAAKLDGSVPGRVHNLPVLDAPSSEIFLVSSRLEDGERNRNPFGKWLLESRPEPAHKVDGNLGGQLEALGWETTTPEGMVVDAISPGQQYVFRIYWEVVRAISGNWETFVHIDGYRRRFNGDHKTLEGQYPFHLWRPGDMIADLHSFRLDPNFTPGTYQVFYGLFSGSRRLEVKRGDHDEDRLRAGTIVVR
jgi:4-amino-4-deoxy-L-arabinose transferase-like glycosyltransferase